MCFKIVFSYRSRLSAWPKGNSLYVMFIYLQQWRTFARQWWLYDAANQDPHVSAHRIIPYLQGKHKPIYHPLSEYSKYH